MSELVIIVTGSRKWTLIERVHTLLDSYEPTYVIEGNCPTGADLHARQWLVRQGKPTRSYTADWKRFGKAAGMIRNGEMLQAWRQHPNVLVLAFPMAEGRGTQDCVRQAWKLGMRVENFGSVEVSP